jgi:hypothetical protein
MSMDNDFEPLPPTDDLATPAYGTAPTEPTAELRVPAVVGPGWYLDPWNPAQHRYWSGTEWTGQTFPHGPGRATVDPGWAAGSPTATPTAPPPSAQASASEPWNPPPPAWAPAEAGRASDLADPPAAMVQSPPRDSRLLAVIALVVGLAVGFVLAFAVGSSRHHTTSHSAPIAIPPLGTFPFPPATSPPSTAPPGPADPASSALTGLVLHQSDVGTALVVAPIPGGNLVAGEPTLDLCGATFASESLRTARLQVAGTNPQGDTPLSTEAVLYSTPNGTTQAFSELRAAAAHCSPAPVRTPNGDTETTHINAAPDGGWPATATVDRLAYDFTTTDQLNQSQHWIAVFLRRGRVLEGIYFASPDGPQPAVDGQTTVSGIVGVFASRIAQLPASTVNG